MFLTHLPWLDDLSPRSLFYLRTTVRTTMEIHFYVLQLNYKTAIWCLSCTLFTFINVKSSCLLIHPYMRPSFSPWPVEHFCLSCIISNQWYSICPLSTVPHWFLSGTIPACHIDLDLISNTAQSFSTFVMSDQHQTGLCDGKMGHLFWWTAD